MVCLGNVIISKYVVFHFNGKITMNNILNGSELAQSPQILKAKQGWILDGRAPRKSMVATLANHLCPFFP